MAQNTIVQNIIGTALGALDQERRDMLTSLAKTAYETGDINRLRYERDHWARMTADSLAESGTWAVEDAYRYADLYRFAHTLLIDYFKSDEFAARSGAVKELRRPVDTTEHIERTADGISSQAGLGSLKTGAEL